MIKYQTRGGLLSSGHTGINLGFKIIQMSGCHNSIIAQQKQQQLKTNLKHERLRACYNIVIYHFTADDDLKRFFRI